MTRNFLVLGGTLKNFHKLTTELTDPFFVGECPFVQFSSSNDKKTRGDSRLFYGPLSIQSLVDKYETVK